MQITAIYINDKIAIMRGMQSGWYRKDGHWYTGPFATETDASEDDKPDADFLRDRQQDEEMREAD